MHLWGSPTAIWGDSMKPGNTFRTGSSRIPTTLPAFSTWAISRSAREITHGPRSCFRILQARHGGEEPPSIGRRTKGFECLSDSLQRLFAWPLSVSTPFRLPWQSLQPFASGADSTGFDRADGADPETSGPTARPLPAGRSLSETGQARRRPKGHRAT